jgi:hypothetical protein
MIRTRTAMIANTNKMWINPPSVYELTKPSSHKTNNTTATVQSMRFFPLLFELVASDKPKQQGKERLYGEVPTHKPQSI